MNLVSIGSPLYRMLHAMVNTGKNIGTVLAMITTVADVVDYGIQHHSSRLVTETTQNHLFLDELPRYT